jgi:Peptidase family M48
MAFVLALALACFTGAGFAQAPRPTFWDVERMAASALPVLPLYRNDGDRMDLVRVSRLRMLREVKSRIETAAGITVHFAITDIGLPNPNAYAISNDLGNFIAINLAMMNLLGDDADAVAAVLGHEFAHITLRHRAANPPAGGDKERAADESGLAYAAAAGFSVNGGVRAWMRLTLHNGNFTLPAAAATSERLDAMRARVVSYSPN